MIFKLILSFKGICCDWCKINVLTSVHIQTRVRDSEARIEGVFTAFETQVWMVEYIETQAETYLGPGQTSMVELLCDNR